MRLVPCYWKAQESSIHRSHAGQEIYTPRGDIVISPSPGSPGQAFQLFDRIPLFDQLGHRGIGTEHWIIACIRELHEFQENFNFNMLQNRHPLDSVIMLLFMIAVKGSEVPLIISICMVIGIRCSSIRKVKVGDRTALKGGVSNKLYK